MLSEKVARTFEKSLKRTLDNSTGPYDWYSQLLKVSPASNGISMATAIAVDMVGIRTTSEGVEVVRGFIEVAFADGALRLIEVTRSTGGTRFDTHPLFEGVDIYNNQQVMDVLKGAMTDEIVEALKERLNETR